MFQLDYYFFLRNTGNHAESTKCHMMDLQLSEDLEDRKGVGRAYNNIANSYISQGEYPKAVEFFSKAVKVWEKCQDEEAKRITFNGLGIAFTEMKEVDQAVEMFCRALEISCVMQDEAMQQTVLKNLCWLFGKVWESGDGLSLLEHCVHYFTEKGKEEVACLLSDNFSTAQISSCLDIRSKKTGGVVTSCSVKPASHYLQGSYCPGLADSVVLFFRYLECGPLKTPFLFLWALSSQEDTLFAKVSLHSFLKKCGLHISQFKKEGKSLLASIVDDFLLAGKEEACSVTPTMMYELLVRPVESVFSEKITSVFFIPCEPLWHFPFVTLSDPSRKKALAREHCIHVSPSYRILNSLKEKEEKERKTYEMKAEEMPAPKLESALVIGSPPECKWIEFFLEEEEEYSEQVEQVFSTEKDLPEIAIAEKEATHVENFLKETLQVGQVVSHINDKENCVASCLRNAGAFQLIHVATYVNESGCLLFSGSSRKDCILSPKMVSRLNLSQTLLVVLSLRFVPSANPVQGHKLVGLVSAFLNAGVKHVLLSLPNSVEQTFARHSVHFYKHLHEHSLDVHKAYKQSVLQMAREEGQIRNLYSALSLFG